MVVKQLKSRQTCSPRRWFFGLMRLEWGSHTVFHIIYASRRSIITCTSPPNYGSIIIRDRYLVMADAELVIVNVPVGSAIQLPAGTPARVALETLRYHPRAGQGVLSNRHNVLVVPSEAMLQAADGPYLFEAASELHCCKMLPSHACLSHAGLRLAWSNSHAMFHCLTTIFLKFIRHLGPMSI